MDQREHRQRRGAFAEADAEVDQRLYQQISNRAESDVQGDLERVSAQVSTVFSDLRRYQSFADAQAALGRIYSALGIDPAPERNPVITKLTCCLYFICLPSNQC